MINPRQPSTPVETPTTPVDTRIRLTVDVGAHAVYWRFEGTGAGGGVTCPRMLLEALERRIARIQACVRDRQK